jgi:hypothetical protein
MFEASEGADEPGVPPLQKPTEVTREDVGYLRDRAIRFAESAADCVQSVACLVYSLY